MVLTSGLLLVINFTDKCLAHPLLHQRLETGQVHSRVVAEDLLRKAAIFVHVVNLQAIDGLLGKGPLP